MRRYGLLLGILLTVFTSGCFYELRDEFTECRINCSNKWAARFAWRDARCACMGIACKHSFKEGFIAGYVAVANGGSGCLPAVPQIECCSKMWLDRCSESEKMEAWYDGYEQGVIAARAEGMADANRITTRAPHPTTAEYLTPARSNMLMPQESSTPELTVPPAPVSPPVPIGGPQTMRQPGEVPQ